MPQSLALVLVHLIFSTKDRAPLLDVAVRPDLYAYMSTIARNAGCECFRAGGVADHIHLAIRLPRTKSIAEVVEELKVSSSIWLKTQSPRLTKLSWQSGYGAFSIGPADLNAVIAYIDAQEAHHSKQTFQEELRAFLTKYGVEFDERYVWD
ncbi:MAG TPA: IS200/IS605 family transposase [Acidobacteriaceae bacterium]|jgi:REP element-mobilizing transposase RayT